MLSGHFTDLVLLMVIAVSEVWLFKRVNLPAILAYLLCGVFAGRPRRMENAESFLLEGH
jgi:Kef-type K+ transport system membrane component KefB